MAGKAIVQCSAGHLFTATWLPLIGIKSLRITPSRRYARCPVERHWGMVTKIDAAHLTEPQLIAAQAHDAGLQ
ncbi:hypothetical protein [Streptomyces sp. NBC_00996]|uniref:hypothetical protein n=1 Tax=Streptomyces sp. NBC_00996 TaxID=2903710 RepID=UPI0038707CF8|nr:hypothetical protein OG390_20090 [Streptomyces sp. NBC_00996]